MNGADALLMSAAALAVIVALVKHFIVDVDT